MERTVTVMAEYIDKHKVQMVLCVLPAELDAEAVQRCIEAVHNIPAADVRENVMAEWVRCDKHIVKCPKCGNFLDMRGVNAGRGDANFCPNCGAQMGGA